MSRRGPSPSSLVLLVAAALVASGTRTAGAPAAPPPAAVAAWDDFVARAEQQLHACACDRGAPEGRAVDVPGGTIHQWRGAVVVPGMTVAQVVDALRTRGIPPPQDDVLESRLLSRSEGVLAVYIRLTRRTVVSVTYDTEHLVWFEQRSPFSAASRSVATRISQHGGRDRGFLWRLHSYWRYTQEGDDVRVELESLSLSRGVPLVLKPAVSPVVNRVARESMARTLEAVRKYLQGLSAS